MHFGQSLLRRYAQIARKVRVRCQETLKITFIFDPLSALMRTAYGSRNYLANAFKNNNESPKCSEFDEDPLLSSSWSLAFRRQGACPGLPPPVTLIVRQYRLVK